MKALLAGLLLAAPALVSAGELAPIVGRYAYTDYSVTLPTGRVLHLRDLNATSASLELTDSDSLTLRMTLNSGEVVVQTAHLLEAHFANGVGFWRAKWPDMSYPVRTDITVKGDTLTTVIKFENPFDDRRYGSIERGTLKKTTDK